jgi:hypothetical protein
VGGLDELLRRRVADTGDGGDDVHGDRERVALGTEAHGGLHDRLRGVDALRLGDEAERPLEAGAVADGEELLGVGAGARAAGLLRRGQAAVEDPLLGLRVTLAAAGAVGAGGVHDLVRSVGHVRPNALRASTLPAVSAMWDPRAGRPG